MRTILKGILIGVVLLVSAGRAFAYPPDNAAVLYYKAFLLMKEPNDTEEIMLRQLSTDDIKVNAQVRLCLESNREAIKEVVTAAQIKNCDWGHDFSQGASMPLCHLKKCRDTVYLLAADSKMLAEKGDYKTALERCITMHRMGIHLGDDILLQKVVGSAMEGRASKRIMEILPQASNDTATLEWLKGQLADIAKKYPSIGTAIQSDAVFLGNSLNREMVLDVALHGSEKKLSKDDQDKLNQVLNQHNNDAFYARLREYYKNVISIAHVAYDLPYPQAKQKLEDLYGEIKNAAKEKPEAIITQYLFPEQDFYGVLSTETNHKTRLNAVLAGIDIYLIKAKTGKLPDKLPEGLPRDLFSGKDFLYEKTDAGFTLTGQGKDLDKDIVHKYEFKVAK
ncbi:MAG: hypothetical protein ABSF37_08280 [Sedimentisphaerales bacterium]|jgi:hypothetical protein